MCSVGIFKKQWPISLSPIQFLGKWTVCKILEDERQNWGEKVFLSYFAVQDCNQMNLSALWVIYRPSTRKAAFQILVKYYCEWPNRSVNSRFGSFE